VVECGNLALPPVFSQRQKKITGALNIYCAWLHIFYPMTVDVHTCDISLIG